MAELKPGSRWKSAVCTTEVIVVKAPGGDLDLRCGGAPMGEPGTETVGEPASGADGGTALGKRYVDADETLELLCTKAGAGSLAVGDTPLGLKESKPLPASD
jgi:hypothetical protein